MQFMELDSFEENLIGTRKLGQADRVRRALSHSDSHGVLPACCLSGADSNRLRPLVTAAKVGAPHTVRIAVNRCDGRESHSRKEQALWPVELVCERTLVLFLNVWPRRFPSHLPLRAISDGCRTWAQAASLRRGSPVPFTAAAISGDSMRTLSPNRFSSRGQCSKRD
jgi:hypothetical protein